jgi:hypothetical protein
MRRPRAKSMMKTSPGSAFRCGMGSLLIDAAGAARPSAPRCLFAGTCGTLSLPRQSSSCPGQGKLRRVQRVTEPRSCSFTRAAPPAALGRGALGCHGAVLGVRRREGDRRAGLSVGARGGRGVATKPGEGHCGLGRVPSGRGHRRDGGSVPAMTPAEARRPWWRRHVGVRETFLARIIAEGSSLTCGATVPLPRRASSSK